MTRRSRTRWRPSSRTASTACSVPRPRIASTTSRSTTRTIRCRHCRGQKATKPRRLLQWRPSKTRSCAAFTASPGRRRLGGASAGEVGGAGAGAGGVRPRTAQRSCSPGLPGRPPCRPGIFSFADWGVSAEAWSVTSYKALREDGLEVERWNRLHPASTPRVPYVTQALEAAEGPIVAVTDFLKAVPDQIARFVAAPFTTLGTDGFGRSDTRAALRRHFEVDAAHIVVAVLASSRRRRRDKLERGGGRHREIRGRPRGRRPSQRLRSRPPGPAHAPVSSCERIVDITVNRCAAGRPRLPPAIGRPYPASHAPSPRSCPRASRSPGTPRRTSTWCKILLPCSLALSSTSRSVLDQQISPRPADQSSTSRSVLDQQIR